MSLACAKWRPSSHQGQGYDLMVVSRATDAVPARLNLARRPYLVIALAVGSVVALSALWVFFGPRKDFASALLTFSLWMKWAYALGVSAAAFSLCARLARPEGAPGALPLVLGVPFLVLGAMALIEISGVPADERRVMWLGRTALI